jgi:NhaA family Na+:H+ antiporter
VAHGRARTAAGHRLIDALHPWVAFGIMPLFALANAGVSLQGTDLAEGGAHWVMVGVAVALVLGKPVGVFATTWPLVKLRLCRLPAGMDWSGTVLVGSLAGIGSRCRFSSRWAHDPNQMAAAKLGVLLVRLVAAVLGLGWGWWRVGRAPAPGADMA